MLKRRDFLLGFPVAGSATCAPLPTPGAGLHQMADDIYWVDAANAEAQASNRGRVAHTGVVVAPHGLIVVDPGPSFKSGAALRELLQDRLRRPVLAVVNTHPHPENVLANSAFSNVPIYASAVTRKVMSRRCPTCLARLRDALGVDEMSGTRIVLPTRELVAGRIQRIAGIDFAVRVFPHAHSQGDLALFEPRSRTLFGGGLAYKSRVPEMQEASTLGWLKALETLAKWPIRNCIGSGVGPAADTVVATRQYLIELAGDVSREIRRGGDIGNLTSRPDAAWSQWQEVQRRHPLNVQHVWHELEDLWWRGKLPPTWQ